MYSDSMVLLQNVGYCHMDAKPSMEENYKSRLFFAVDSV